MIIYEQVQLRSYFPLVALSLNRKTKPSEFFLGKPLLFRNELQLLTLSWYNLASHICLLSGKGFLFLQLLSGTGSKFNYLCLQPVRIPKTHRHNPVVNLREYTSPASPPGTERRLPMESISNPTLAFARLAYLCFKRDSSSQLAKQ